METMTEGCRDRARRVRPAALLLTVLLLAGCDYLPFGFTSVTEILAHPTSFEGQEVKIRGTVKDVTKVPILDLKVYTVQDHGAGIAVFTNGTLPAVGQTVTVKGKVESTAIINGQSLGLHIEQQTGS
jgi:cytochrome c-type biogenesis protein CcmE